MLNLMKFALMQSAALVAFNPGAKWKMDDDRIATDSDGNPVIVTADGERAVQGNTIARLNAEAKQHRERAEAAEAALEPFKGLDALRAREALDTVSKLDSKALLDAGEVERVRNEAITSVQKQIDERDQKLASLQDRLNQVTLQAEFAKSSFVKEKIAVPPEMFLATFGNNFKVEDGKIVAYGSDGNLIHSTKRLGERATVDEAFEFLVENSPFKDQILRAPDIGGSGGSGGGNRGTGRVIKRSEFAALPPVQQAEYASAMQRGEIKIAD